MGRGSSKAGGRVAGGGITPTNEVPINRITPDGETNPDGSITMQYLHISQRTANYGDTYGQNIEPTGEYMNYIPEGTRHIEQPNYTYGTIHFNNPLIIEHRSTGANGWKRDLSERYGGKKKRALSNAIIKDGYDAIVTYEIFRGQRVWNEIVNLNGQKL